VAPKSRKTAVNVMPMHASIILTTKGVHGTKWLQRGHPATVRPVQGIPGNLEKRGARKRHNNNNDLQDFSWGKKSQNPFCNF
jgi:hypothetical protein